MKIKNGFYLLNKKLKGFTLIEMILSVTLFAFIILIAFDSLSSIGIFKTKMSYKLDLNQDLYNAVENIVSVVKDFGGDIDYEEYWNRSSVGTNIGSGHYSKQTGFGNYGSGGNISLTSYGSGFYFCRSGSGVSMGTGGCLKEFNNYGGSFTGKYQRFGQYAFQFIDYNINEDNEIDNGKCSTSGGLGDENCDGNIRGDADDENLGIGPVAFSGNEVKELYLIKKGDTQERLFFRLNIIQDPDTTDSCNFSDGTGTGCLGNIQMLKLIGYDSGFDHDNSGSGAADGIIDTWKCHDDFNCIFPFPTGNDSEWINLLPDYINVKNLKIFIYPNKDYRYSWKEYDINTRINSYIRFNIVLGFSHLKRKQIKGISPEINISTTVNLNNF